jgi:hypothetical protein
MTFHHLYLSLHSSSLFIGVGSSVFMALRQMTLGSSRPTTNDLTSSSSRTLHQRPKQARGTAGEKSISLMSIELESSRSESEKMISATSDDDDKRQLIPPTHSRYFYLSALFATSHRRRRRRRELCVKFHQFSLLRCSSLSCVVQQPQRCECVCQANLLPASSMSFPIFSFLFFSLFFLRFTFDARQRKLRCRMWIVVIACE